jgi:hypothetical protein
VGSETRLRTAPPPVLAGEPKSDTRELSTSGTVKTASSSGVWVWCDGALVCALACPTPTAHPPCMMWLRHRTRRSQKLHNYECVALGCVGAWQGGGVGHGGRVGQTASSHEEITVPAGRPLSARSTSWPQFTEELGGGCARSCNPTRCVH